MTTSLLADVKKLHKGAGRFWFYRPSLYWYGWETLVPFALSHDEFSRTTLMLGWTITGRVVIALRPCGDEDCYAQTLRDVQMDYDYDDREGSK